jgi:hypothetical protein
MKTFKEWVRDGGRWYFPFIGGEQWNWATAFAEFIDERVTANAKRFIDLQVQTMCRAYNGRLSALEDYKTNFTATASAISRQSISRDDDIKRQNSELYRDLGARLEAALARINGLERDLRQTKLDLVSNRNYAKNTHERVEAMAKKAAPIKQQWTYRGEPAPAHKTARLWDTEWRAAYFIACPETEADAYERQERAQYYTNTFWEEHSKKFRIELSAEEVKALRTVLNRIGGDLFNSRRRHFDAIGIKLTNAGASRECYNADVVEGRYPHGPETTGTIYFRTLPSPHKGL